MKDISNFEENDRYKLYDVIILKSKKKEGLWFAKKKYLSFKEIEDKRFDSYSEEMIDGKPVTTGYLFIYENNIDNIEDIDNKTVNQKYELTIARDVRGEKIVDKGIKVSSKKEIMCLTISPLRKTKEKQKDYCFLTVQIKEEDFDKANNQEEIIEAFRKKGLSLEAETHKGYYQFNTLLFPMARQIPMLETYANQTIHLETFVQSKEDTFDLNRIGRPVFAEGPLLVEGEVISVEDNMVGIKMLTNWDKLAETNNRNIIHFTSEERKTLDEPTENGDTLELKFIVNATSGFSGSIGDKVSFELNEDNVKKVLNTKISVEFNKEEKKVEEVNVTKEQVEEKAETPAETNTPNVEEDGDLPF